MADILHREYHSSAFKMLVILDGAPVTTPSEAFGAEEAASEVVAGYLMGEGLGAVGIACGGGRLDDETAVAPLHAGIVKRVDVDGQPLGVLGKFLCTCHGTVTEAGSVVGLHGTLVVIAILTDGTDALDGITRFIQLAEDVKKVFGDVTMADENTLLGLSVKIHIQHPQQSQLISDVSRVRCQRILHHFHRKRCRRALLCAQTRARTQENKV